MKINLAKVVPFVFVAIAALFAILAQNSGTATDDTGSSYASGPTKSDRAHTAADAYLDQVAIELAQPGLYVDPEVSESDFSRAEAARLGELAAKADGPVRIAVIPVARIRPDDSDRDSSYVSSQVAYTGVELAGQIYDRVGSDGTYAVLVDASSQSAGRSFYAGQWAEDGPTYDVEGAAEDAISCCAPGYASMVEEFISESQDVQHSFWWWAAWICGPIAALIAAVKGIKVLGRRRRSARGQAEIVDVLRAPLNEEVIEISAVVSALPPAGGDPDSDLSVATLKVLDLVEAARHRLDALKTGQDATEITSRLADARYQLTAIEALRAGRKAPDRTPPCFFDPRHGPSSVAAEYAPEGGAERQVHACRACADMVAAEQQPPIRMIEKAGRLRFYWELDMASKPYLDGYWQRNRHPVREAQAARNLTFASLADDPDDDGEPAFTFVWESGDGGSGWGGSGGSSRVRSFGGGSSSRSSFRSGGGGGF
ncbi:hypothetical protein [Nocardioides jensenii]|uniref:hypothetical protein n=1 Tax=Nocardioides jensenii TaxID=1843 RepID=UPI00082CB5FA|nr:hypothetical protein [Nocardioides jensenii]